MTRIGVVGAGGRMGRQLIQAIIDNPDAALGGATERGGSDLLGSDAGTLVGSAALGVTVSDDMTTLSGCNAIVDFTAPAATRQMATFCAEHGIAHIIGTTGMNDDDQAVLERAARQTVLLQSGK